MHRIYKRLFINGNIHDTQLGGCGNVAANGDIFPLFALIEDFGYLPRIAFNLDKFFSKCGAHGKQGLTMAMESAVMPAELRAVA